MERFTISLDDDLARDFDALISERGYASRSEAVRDLLRSQIEASRQNKDRSGWCVANLSYVYNHHERELAERLTSLQHGSHDLSVATMHAHLDHDNCLESVILRGPRQAVEDFAAAITAERGVRHGHVNVITVEIARDAHSHGYRPKGAVGHVHLKPRS